MILDDFSSPVGDFNQAYWDRSNKYPRFFAKSNPFEANALFAKKKVLQPLLKPFEIKRLTEGLQSLSQ